MYVQGTSTLGISNLIQCFNQILATGFITAKVSQIRKFDVKYVNTMKPTTYQVRVFKRNRMFGRKQIDCKRPPSTKQMNRVQNNCIEIYKQKHNQVRLELAVFATTKLALYSVSPKF